MPADVVGEYIRIGGRAAAESPKYLCATVVAAFGDEHICSPTEDDIMRLLAMHETRGVAGMLGSLDCIHWSWKTARQHRKYKHKEKSPNMLLKIYGFGAWFLVCIAQGYQRLGPILGSSQNASSTMQL